MLTRKAVIMGRNDKSQINFQGVSDSDCSRMRHLQRDGEQMPALFGRLVDALEEKDARIKAATGLPGCEQGIILMEARLSAILNTYVESCNNCVSANEAAEAKVALALESKDRAIVDLQKLLDESRDEVRGLRDVADRLEDLEVKYSEAVSSSERLSAECAAANEAASAALSEKQEALAQSSEAYKSLADSRKAEQELRDQLAALDARRRKEIDALKEESSKTLQRQESSRRDAERDLALAEQARENLSADLAKTEESLSSMTERAGRLEAKCDELTAQLSDARGREVDLEREVGRLNAELISANLAKKAEQKEGQKE